MENTKINLQDFVGKRVSITPEDGVNYNGIVVIYSKNAECVKYTIIDIERDDYSFGNLLNKKDLLFNQSGICINMDSKHDIMSISPTEQHFGHRYPNIDIAQFLGKDVYVKLNRELSSADTRFVANNCTIAKVLMYDNRYVVNGFYVKRDGKLEGVKNAYIEEINTGFTVAPTGPIVEPLDIVLSDSLKEIKTKLSKEQIQKLRNLL
jgi:hypothetical protein